jgi:hypothetical protein
MLSIYDWKIGARYASLCVIILIYIIAFCGWASRGFKEFGSSLSFLLKESDHEIRNEIIKDDDQTTIEFNDIFDSIIKKTGNSGKFVIVLDNIDRLPTEKIRDAWATMRNFFVASQDGNRFEVLQNIWVVVPYDRNHLGRIFNDENVNGVESRHELLREYIGKTFDIVIRVSPPLLSDWRKFFDDLLGEVFGGEIDEIETHKLFRLFEKNSINESYVITPRMIKKYVNDIVCISIQWGEVIPISCVGFFVLVKNKLEEDISLLKTEKLVDWRISGILDDVDWPKFLAAIYFNVQPDHAYEFLLGQDVERSLVRSELDQLKRLAKNRGFLLVLSNIINEKSAEWARDDFELFCSVCSVLKELEIESSVVFSEIWHAMALGTGFIVSWDTLTDGIKDGLVTLVSQIDERERSTICNQVIQSLEENGSGKGLNSFASGIIWVQIVDSIFENFVGDGVEERDFNVPGTASFYCGAASVARNLANLEWEQFETSVDPQSLGAQVAGYLALPNIPDEVSDVISSISKDPQSCEWTTVIGACSKRLNTNEPGLSTSDCLFLLRVLLRLSSLSGVSNIPDLCKSVLTELYQNGTILGLLCFGMAQRDPKLMGGAFWCFSYLNGISVPTHPASHSVWGDLSSTDEIIQKIQTTPESYEEIIEEVAADCVLSNSVPNVLSLAVGEGKESEVFKAVTRRIVRVGVLGSLSIGKIFEDYDVLATILGDELEEKFIRQFANWSPHFRKIVSGDGTKIISSRFIEKSVNAKIPGIDVAIDLVKKHLSSKNIESWMNSLDAEDDDLRLLIAMNKNSGFVVPPGNFRKPLAEKIRKILETGEFPQQNIGKWNHLPFSLSNRSRGAFVLDAWRIICSDGWETSRILDVVELLGASLIERIPVDRLADQIVLNVITPIIGEATPEGLGWIENNASQLGKCVERSSTKSKDLLREYMSGALSVASNRNEKILRKISRLWKVRARKNIFKKWA